MAGGGRCGISYRDPQEGGWLTLKMSKKGERGSLRILALRGVILVEIVVTTGNGERNSEREMEREHFEI